MQYIAELITRNKEWADLLPDLPNEDIALLLRENAAVLGALTAIPPNRIARLVEQVQAAYEDGTTPLRYVDLFKEVVNALLVQAQENRALEDRSQRRISALSNSVDQWSRAYAQLEAQIQPPNAIGDNCTAELAAQCASLEAERDGWKDRCERAISDRDRARIAYDILAQEKS